jgi:hypothetical protein
MPLGLVPTLRVSAGFSRGLVLPDRP